MAEHAPPARKPAEPAASAKAPAAAAPGSYGELLNRRSEAALAGYAQLLAHRAAANPLIAPIRAPGPKPVQLKSPNRTGLPDGLKRGVEMLSGLAMDDVRVHRNSSEPAKLGALAFARGSDIHMGPSQEAHLPHEAWHVVQQKRGSVRPTRRWGGAVAINDQGDLEREADAMGEKSIRAGSDGPGSAMAFAQLCPARDVLQAVWVDGDPERWDEPIDGVQWFRNSDGKLWYQMLEGAPQQFGRYAGGDHARDAAQWDELEGQLGRVGQMMERIAAYEATPGVISEVKRPRPRRDRVSPIRTPVATPVLVNDPDRPVPLTGWTDVEDHVPSVTEGGSTKFINMFRHPEGGGPADAVVMRENYRERERRFFASDAFFSQWMASAGYRSLEEIPVAFPRYFYRNNISNVALQPRLEALLAGRDSVDVPVPGDVWTELQGYENVKSTQTIIADFNRLNATRERPPVHIVAMKIIKGPGIRFEIG